MTAPAPSKLDERQILQAVLDEEQGRLRVDAVASISNVSIAVDLVPSEDGVYIADKTTGNKLVINSDGSINANIASGISGVVRNIFNEQLAVASGATVSLVSYTVPAGKTAILERIWVSGENIAKYEVYVNASKIDVGRTYFGSQLNALFEYMSSNGDYILASTNTVIVTIRHDRPSSGNFEGRIQLTEIG